MRVVASLICAALLVLTAFNISYLAKFDWAGYPTRSIVIAWTSIALQAVVVFCVGLNALKGRHHWQAFVMAGVWFALFIIGPS